MANHTMKSLPLQTERLELRPFRLDDQEGRANFARALHREMPDTLIDWCSPEQISMDIDERLQIELDRCEDMTFAESFAAACPVEGCGSEDYLQRVVTSGSRQQLLTGIRFHGGTGFPFVDLIAAAQPLDEAQAMEHALDSIRAEYAAFEPQAVRLLRAADRPLMLPTESRHPSTNTSLSVLSTSWPPSRTSRPEMIYD